MRRRATIAALCLLPMASGTAFALAPPDITNTNWIGAELFKAKLKGIGKILEVSFNTLDIDGGDDCTYTSFDTLTFNGSIFQDGKKLLTTLDAGELANMADQLETFIEDAVGLFPDSVTAVIDPTTLKLKGKVKAKKDGNFIRIKMKFKYTATSDVLGTRSGKVKIKAIFTQV